MTRRAHSQRHDERARRPVHASQPDSRCVDNAADARVRRPRRQRRPVRERIGGSTPARRGVPARSLRHGVSCAPRAPAARSRELSLPDRAAAMGSELSEIAGRLARTRRSQARADGRVRQAAARPQRARAPNPTPAQPGGVVLDPVQTRDIVALAGSQRASDQHDQHARAARPASSHRSEVSDPAGKARIP